MNGTTNAHKRVLVLDDESHTNELSRLAAASDWQLVARFPSGIDECVELQWAVAPEVTAAYVEYHMDGVRVVSVRGTESEAEAVDAAADAVAGAVATRSVSSMLDQLLCDPPDDPVAITQTWRSLTAACSLALPDEPLDDRLVTAVERYLTHANRQVRLRTIMVADALGGRWPRLVDLVLARKGADTELDYVLDAFVAMLDQAE